MNISRFLVICVIIFILSNLTFSGFCVSNTFTSSSSTVEPEWNIEMVKANQFWNATNYRGEDIKIAIIDSGVNYNLPDLDDNYIEEDSWNYVHNNSDLMDDCEPYGHGTMCASIAVGEGDDKIVGVAPKAEYFALKVVEADRTIHNYTYLVQAIWHAIEHGADIISISYEYYYEHVPGEVHTEMQIACTYAYEHGVIIVAASGNQGKSHPAYPAAYGGTVAVAACDQNGQLWEKTNRGYDLIAPGVDVPVLDKDGNLVYLNGTSLACPHVAGAAALLLSKYGKWSSGKWCADEVRQVLKVSATPLVTPQPELLDCYNMIGYRAFLKNAGFEADRGEYGLSPWEYNIQHGDCAAEWNVIRNEYEFGQYYFILDGDCHCNMKLTTTQAGQDEVFMRTTYHRNNFTICHGESGKSTRMLYAILRFPVVEVSCYKARISIIVEFNSTTETKWIYYSWYKGATDANTTTTKYINLGEATEFFTYYLDSGRDLRQDFNQSFGFQLNKNWYISSITIEIHFEGTSSNDKMEILAGDIRLYADFKNSTIFKEDINKDEKVDIEDIFTAALAYGSYPGHPNWDPRCDVNNDLKVDVMDIYLITLKFGEDC